jgi:quercetin dioxygenase-like cupin family protein
VTVSTGRVERAQERLAAQGLSAGSWSNGPHDRYAAHRHGYDKVLVCGAGSIDFELPELGRTVRLDPGDRLDLPAGTLHAATVGAEGVTCLEAHLAAGSLASQPVTTPGWATETDPSAAA